MPELLCSYPMSTSGWKLAVAKQMAVYGWSAYALLLTRFQLKRKHTAGIGSSNHHIFHCKRCAKHGCLSLSGVILFLQILVCVVACFNATIQDRQSLAKFLQVFMAQNCKHWKIDQPATSACLCTYQRTGTLGSFQRLCTFGDQKSHRCHT